MVDMGTKICKIWNHTYCFYIFSVPQSCRRWGRSHIVPCPQSRSSRPGKWIPLAGIFSFHSKCWINPRLARWRPHQVLLTTSLAAAFQMDANPLDAWLSRPCIIQKHELCCPGLDLGAPSKCSQRHPDQDSQVELYPLQNENSLALSKIWKSGVHIFPPLYSPRRKSVMTSPRQRRTGRVWRSPFSWRSRTVRLRYPWCPPPPLWSSRPWRSRHVTARRSRTVSIAPTIPNHQQKIHSRLQAGLVV